MFKRLIPLLEADGEIGAASEEPTSVESTESAPVQVQEEHTETPAPEEKPDNPRSFANRLKEQTEKALAEERAKFEQEREQIAQQARDKAIADLGLEWNGKPITTEADYRLAKEEEAILKQYEHMDLSDEQLQQILDDRRFRMQAEPKLAEIERQQKFDSDYQAFIAAYPEVDPKEIPREVWADVDAGKSLVDAWVRHENQLLKQKLAQIEQKQQIEQQNQDNAASSTGSVTGGGDSGQAFYTREQVEAMSPEQVNKNYGAIVASMKKWK